LFSPVGQSALEPVLKKDVGEGPVNLLFISVAEQSISNTWLLSEMCFSFLHLQGNQNVDVAIKHKQDAEH
jgi:hypothetical protein